MTAKNLRPPLAAGSARSSRTLEPPPAAEASQDTSTAAALPTGAYAARILENASEGRGVVLSPEEVKELAQTEAVKAAAPAPEPDSSSS